MSILDAAAPGSAAAVVTVKPLPAAPFTKEDARIFYRLGTGMFFSGALSHAHFMHSMESDRRDAQLMLGLTGTAPGAAGICVAYLWLIGCVIHNGTTGTRVAMRGFEADYGPDREDITYFA